MSSIVEICNTAIMELGGEPISSLEETSVQAVACNTVWNQCRQIVLRSHPWNFATVTIDLAQLASNPRKFRYDYAYQVPSNLLRLLKVTTAENHIDPVTDYKLEGNVIFSNEDTCLIKYIYDNISTTSWDPLFADCVAAKVQSKIAMPITRDLDNKVNAEQLYQTRLMAAQIVDSSEDIEDEIMEPESLLISGRY